MLRKFCTLMKRISLKEILVLLVPALILLGASFWWQKREQRDAVKESGPFRLEVAKIEKVVPTPAEVAEGYDTKFLVTFAYRGNDPLAAYRRDNLNITPFTIASNAKLLERKEGQWREISRRTSPQVRVAGAQLFSQINNRQIAILLPLSQLPKSELRVQFSALLRVGYLVPKGVAKPHGGEIRIFPVSKEKGSDGVSVNLRLPKILIPVRKAGEPASIPQVSHARSIALVSANVIRVATPASIQNGQSGIDTRVEIYVRGTETNLRKQQKQKWKSFNTCLVDESGKIYRTWQQPFGRLNSLVFLLQDPNSGLQQDSSASEGVCKFQTDFSQFFIPASAGEITFRTQISFNDEWPVPVSVVVRKRDDWTLKKSRTLKLKSIKVEPNSPDGSKFDVYVRGTYVGPYDLIESPTPGKVFGADFYYGYNSLSYKYGLNTVYLDKNIRTPNRRLFVTNWSQHLESAAPNITGTKNLLSLRQSNPVRLTHVVLGDEFKVIYAVDLSKLTTRPKNLIFKADIGVEGDGFLPVSVALPISKKP
jgi:hypothetical protein